MQQRAVPPTGCFLRGCSSGRGVAAAVCAQDPEAGEKAINTTAVLMGAKVRIWDVYHGVGMAGLTRARVTLAAAEIARAYHFHGRVVPDQGGCSQPDARPCCRTRPSDDEGTTTLYQRHRGRSAIQVRGMRASRVDCLAPRLQVALVCGWGPPFPSRFS